MKICPICSRKISLNHHTPYNDIGWTDWGIFSNLRIRYCTSCGFAFSVPELNDEVVNHFYETDYRSKESTYHIDFLKLKNIKDNGIGDIRNSRAFGQLYLARAFCDFNCQDILLDIGAGKGGSFKTAKILFDNPSLHAIELSQGAKEYYKKNFDADSHDSLDEFISLNLRAQIIVMSHTLEHYRLSDLSESLTNLSLALAENGVAVIEVPHVDLRIHRENRGIDSPHFLFFSKESLALLFEQNSFKVLFIDTCGPLYQSTESFLASQRNSEKMKGLLKKTFNNLPKLVRIILRTVVRNLTKIKNFKPIKKFNKLNSLPYLSYGGNRNSIRIVVKKKQTV